MKNLKAVNAIEFRWSKTKNTKLKVSQTRSVTITLFVYTTISFIIFISNQNLYMRCHNGFFLLREGFQCPDIG